MTDMITIERKGGGLDGAHRGLDDWYPEQTAVVSAVIRSQEKATTGWYSSKHAIATGRVSKIGERIVCEASVTDDFDTPGNGRVEISLILDLDAVRIALVQALHQAYEDQVANRRYAMWSIYNPAQRRVETYLRDVSGLDYPPGDCYYHWGWQHESDVPDDVREKLAKGMDNFQTSVEYKGWRATRA